MKNYRFVLLPVALIFAGINLAAQELTQDVLSKIQYRSIGSTRHSGRFVDFAVNEKNPATFYAALASGGLWKTVNNGTTFDPVFDNYGAYSMSCVLYDPNNTNVIW